jgi:hypothetical protein
MIKDPLTGWDPAEVRTDRDARQFIREVTDLLGLGFHPDTGFDEYVDLDAGGPTFDLVDAARLDGTLERAMEVLSREGFDPYAEALAALEERRLRALPDRVYGHWSEEAETAGFPAKIEGEWPGGVIFATDRDALSLIVEDQERLIADLIPEQRGEQDVLRFDGRSLIHTSGADPEFRQEYLPGPDGLYHGLGFGWTWTDEPYTDLPPRREKTDTRRAYEAGAEAGRAAGSWAADGNTDAETARKVLALIEDGDPAAWDYLPRQPDLSGEFADGPTPQSVYEDATGLDASEASAERIAAVAEAWEQGVGEAFEDACVAELRAVLSR